jgi:hypothetical protein
MKFQNLDLQIRKTGQYAFVAFGVYTICGIIEIRFPLTIDIVTTLAWIFWLIHGINSKHE